MSGSRATLADIALACGVSKMTVSRVVRGIGSASPATRAGILAAAERLGYRPNAAARAVISGRFGCVALLLSAEHRRNNLTGELLHGVHGRLRRDDLHLIVSILDDASLTDPGYVPKILRDSLSDGVLIAYQDGIPNGMAELMERHRVPAVWINSPHAHDCVVPDDAEGARCAVRHLVALGHRRILWAHISVLPAGCTPHFSIAERRRGYLEAIAEAGLEPMQVVYAPGCDARALDALTRSMLSRKDRPTAALSYGPTNSLRLIRVATSLGLTVPRDLSLVEFSPQQGHHDDQPITTVLVPDEAMGVAAVELLLRRIAAGGTRQERLLLPEPFLPGLTTLPPA